MQRLLIMFLLFIIVLLLFSGLFFFYEARFMSGRASTITTGFSPENSYVITTPMKAKAGSQQKMRITATVLNDQGLGVPLKKATIVNPDPTNLIIDTLVTNTDNLGRAMFDVGGKTAGDYYIEVRIDNYALPQKAHLLFY